jgi:hypothetical protein
MGKYPKNQALVRAVWRNVFIAEIFLDNGGAFVI